MEVGIIPLKSLQAGWRRETFQIQNPIWNCLWLPCKLKTISAMYSGMKNKKIEVEKRIISIIILPAGRKRETFQIQYLIRNFFWLPWKWRKISAIDTNMQCRISKMKERIMPINLLEARWRRETFQKQYLKLWNCSWLPWKWKLISWHQCEMWKSQDGEENNAYKIFKSRVVEGNVSNTISYAEFFMALMKIKK